MSFSPILNCEVGEGKDDGKGKELKDIWGSGGSRFKVTNLCASGL